MLPTWLHASVSLCLHTHSPLPPDALWVLSSLSTFRARRVSKESAMFFIHKLPSDSDLALQYPWHPIGSSRAFWVQGNPAASGFPFQRALSPEAQVTTWTWGLESEVQRWWASLEGLSPSSVWPDAISREIVSGWRCLWYDRTPYTGYTTCWSSGL